LVLQERSVAYRTDAAVRYRVARWWSGYVHGVRQRYAFLMTPGQPGFFVAWLGYAVYVAATLRWLIDLLVLAFLRWHECQTPSLARLRSEIEWLPAFMIVGVVIMGLALVSKQTGYVRVIPMWVTETFVTLLPIALVLVAAGLGFFWVDLRYACR
jgi:hypothetical protein